MYKVLPKYVKSINYKTKLKKVLKKCIKKKKNKLPNLCKFYVL